MPRNPYLVRLIVAGNIAIYLMWFFKDLEFMTQNFTVSWLGLSEGRYWTILSSAFAHNFFIHILFNMIVLNSFGSIVEETLGHLRFLKFYVGAAIVSGLTHAAVSALVIGDPELRALGASGAIAGLVMLFSLKFPREKILLFGLIPLPAILGALAFVGLDIWGLVAQTHGGGLPIGHGAHLGGALTGLVYYLYLRVRGRAR